MDCAINGDAETDKSVIQTEANTIDLFMVIQLQILRAFVGHPKRHP